MGRAFEYRKARKLKRWGNMARTFTKLGKEIEIAVKAAGPDPGGNTRLRVLIQNAKAANMPKENVERAIKRAVSKDTADYKEMVYEGYAPFGIAMIIETATDNSTRTVANVRSYFNKAGGSLAPPVPWISCSITSASSKLRKSKASTSTNWNWS